MFSNNRQEVAEERQSLKIGVRKGLLEKCPIQIKTVMLMKRGWKNLILVTHLSYKQAGARRMSCEQVGKI